MKPYPCIEKTIEINTVYQGVEMTLRLWINTDELNDGKQLERINLAQEIQIALNEDGSKPDFDIEHLANYFETIVT